MTRNEQVKTSVCRNYFDGSSANVTLFSSRKICLSWKVFGWLAELQIGPGFSGRARFGIKFPKVLRAHTSPVTTGVFVGLIPPNKPPTH